MCYQCYKKNSIKQIKLSDTLIVCYKFISREIKSIHNAVIYNTVVKKIVILSQLTTINCDFRMFHIYHFVEQKHKPRKLTTLITLKYNKIID